MQYIETLLLLCWLPFYANATVLPDTVETGKEHIKLAQQQEAQNNPDQAIEYYELAKDNFEQKNDNSKLAYALTKIASFCISDSATRYKAEAYLDSAQLFLEERQIENDTLHALIWSTKAELAVAQEDYNHAIEFYQQTLKVNKTFYGKNHLKMARVFEQIGDIFLYNLQSSYASETYYQQARDLLEINNNQSRLLYGIIYNLAYANRLQGDYDKALSYAFEVQQGYQGLKDNTSFDSLAISSLLSTIYYDMGNIEQALHYNKNAINLGKKIQNIDLTDLYNNHARYFYKKQDYDSSFYYTQLAMTDPSSKSLATSYQFLANIYRDIGKLKEAFANYRVSMKIKEANYKHYHTQRATLYVEMGKAFEADQQIDSAIHYYQLALESSRTSQQLEADDRKIRLEDDLGTIEVALINIINLLTNQYYHIRDNGSLKKVLPYLNLFDQFMHLSRRDFSTEGAKLILSGNNKSIYEKAIESCYYLFQSEPSDSLLQLAFYFMEKSKAVVLLESVRETNRNQRLLPDTIVQQYQLLQARLAYHQSKLIEFKNDSLGASVDVQQQRAKVLRELELLDRKVQNDYPNYSAFSNENLTVRLDTLQKSLPIDKAVISYFWGDSAVYTLLIAKERIKFHRINDVNQLQASVSQYQDVLVNDNISDPSYPDFIKFQKSALNLYELLLAPLQLDTTIYHVTIVPDRELAAIPFEGFITAPIETTENDIRYEDLPYLIHQFNFTYELSSSVAFLNKQRFKLADSKQSLNVIAFGIKDFNTLPTQRRYPPLGGAENEVLHIQEKFAQARIFLNEEATEANFKQYALNADLLHVATHGMADQENPFDSRFVFYPAQEEDGTLYLHELYDLSLETQLLVLGACESGVGKYYAGEGSFSLARSFVYAGCQSVLMSLWEINDRLTTQMVMNVYDQLAEQTTASEALRTTKLGFIKQGRLAHPQCWASMVLLGNTPTTFTSSSFTVYQTVLVVVSVVAFLYLLQMLIRKKKRFAIHRQEV